MPVQSSSSGLSGTDERSRTESTSEASSSDRSEETTTPPTMIAGRYRVNAILGRGASGDIFKVTDEANGRQVALKSLRRDANEDSTSVARFEREYHTLASLSHPRIIRVYDYGHEGTRYYTMELVDGADLRDLSPLPYARACRYVRDLASSLALLHTRRLLHRDVSPRNARVGSDGHCKLLDFGALCPFGTARQVVGTPPCIPPEALRHMPLDERVDLYGLGAVAYWVLTGRHAYPTRRFSKLERAWKTPPPPPSAIVGGVPQELDDLVLELLSLDPMERPGSAAAVIDRLTTIAGLPREKDISIAQAYLTHPRLVGRTREMNLLKRSLDRAMAGRGRALRIQGGSGLGKSRLLSELELEARQRGAIAARVDAELHRQPFGTANALALAILEQSHEAVTLAKPRRDALAQLSPELARRLQTNPTAIEAFASERRAVLQEALSFWITSLAARTPLVLIVDNVHRADGPSLALVVALSQEAARCKMLTAISVRNSDTHAHAELLERHHENGVVLELRALSLDDLFNLTESLFGTIPDGRRLATWLDQNTAGNPLYCLELARSLVAQGIVRYEEGSWILPKSAPQMLQAGSIGGVFRFTLSQLSKDALRLAQTLSVHRGALSLELCVAVAPALPGQSHRLLNELVQSGVLSADGDFYHFKHSAVREHLAAQLSVEDRRALHRRLGQSLLKVRGHDHVSVADAGWHLLRGGRETEGAELLASIADKTHKLKAIDTDLQAVIPALSAALEIFQRDQRDPLEQIPLLTALVEAGYYSDRRVAERYGDHAMAAIRHALGLDVAERLRPRLGRTAAVGAGTAIAAVKFHAFSRGRKTYRFRDLFLDMLSTATYLTGVATICLDAAKAERYAAQLEPLTILGHRQAPTGVYEFCRRLALMSRDNLHEARSGWLTALEQLKDPSYYAGLPDYQRRLFRGGALYALGALDSFRDDGSSLESAAALDNLGLRFYEIVADRLRVAHHLYRGEEEAAKRYRQRLDLHAAQLGSAWQVEVWDPAASMTGYARVGDRLGLRNCAERLAALSEEIPSLLRYATMARALYHLSQGEPARCVALYQETLEGQPPRSHLGWTVAQGQLAGAQNAAGDHEGARETCLKALAHVPEADLDFVVMTLELQTELSLARAALGDTKRARHDLESLRDRYPDRGPVTQALIHRAIAVVAALSGDKESALRSLDTMQRQARSTGNAALIGRWKQTAASLEGLGMRDDRLQAFEPPAAPLSQVQLAVPRSLELHEEEEEFTLTESHVAEDRSVTNSTSGTHSSSK